MRERVIILCKKTVILVTRFLTPQASLHSLATEVVFAGSIELKGLLVLFSFTSNVFIGMHLFSVL